MNRTKERKKVLKGAVADTKIERKSLKSKENNVADSPVVNKMTLTDLYHIVQF